MYVYIYIYIYIYIYMQAPLRSEPSEPPPVFVVSPRVEVELNVHEPHLNKCLATMANWDAAPLLRLAKP